MTLANIDVWTLVFFGFACLLLLITGTLIRSIRREVPDLWRELGSPSLFHLEGTTAIYKFWRWLFSGSASRLVGVRSAYLLVVVLRVGTLIYVLAFCAMAWRALG